MQNFHDDFATLTRSFISVLPLCMTVPVRKSNYFGLRSPLMDLPFNIRAYK